MKKQELNYYDEFIKMSKYTVDISELLKELIQDYDYKKLLISQYNDSKDNNSYDDEEEGVDLNSNSYN